MKRRPHARGEARERDFRWSMFASGSVAASSECLVRLLGEAVAMSGVAREPLLLRGGGVFGRGRTRGEEVAPAA